MTTPCILILIFMRLLLMILAQNTPAGFINIDCGLTNGVTQSSLTGLTYTGDEDYVESGEVHTISDAYINPQLVDQLKTLRSFPTGARNCYTVKQLIPGDKYLVRASFFHGNYDGQFVQGVSTVSFNLSLGSQFWRTLLIKEPSRTSAREVLTIAQTSYMSVCLINIDAGTPFMSVLELRQLKNTLYPALVKGFSLSTLTRLNMGGDKEIRYGDDPYDRLWFPPNSNLDCKCSNISTTAFIENIGNGQYEVPSSVLQTAIIPNSSRNLIVNLTDILNQDEPNLHLHVYLSFTRLNLISSITFDLLLDGTPLLSKQFLPYHVNYVMRKTDLIGTSHIFSIVPNSDSDPPVLNAMEVYAVLNGSDGSDHPTFENDIYALMAIKDQYKVKKNWMGDPCSPNSLVWEGLACIYGSFNSKIHKVNLSSSGLTGEINPSFGNLTSTDSLDLSHNSLTGSIPDILGTMSSLRYLNLSGNKLTGTVPPSLLQRSQNKSLMLSIEGNPGLCTNYEGTCKNNKRKKLKPAIIIFIVVPIVLLLLFAPWVFKRLGLWGRNSNLLVDGSGNILQINCEKFTYDDLKQITQNFNEVIGEGGFGTVYLGSKPSGDKVAVKLLNKSSHQGVKEFFAEVQHLSRIHHRNLVSLVGYCDHRVHMAVVYEYMSGGSLRASIRGPAKKKVFSWEERLQILLEASQGLSYLHCECYPPIVHGDVKTDNILLNQMFEAKIADFGLSKEQKEDFMTTDGVAFTPGYGDPQYFQCIESNEREKSDVYSFGVVMLEVFTAKSPVMGYPNKIMHITKWVHQKLTRGSLLDVADAELFDRYDENSASRVVELAMKCCSTPAERPAMPDVVSELKECLEFVRTLTRTTSGSSLRTHSSQRDVAIEVDSSSSLRTRSSQRDVAIFEVDSSSSLRTRSSQRDVAIKWDSTSSDV